MRKVKFHLRAEQEMYGSAEHYEGERPGYGRRFLIAVQKACGVIQRNPEYFPFEEPPYRKFVLKKFKHTLLYRVDEDAIYIIATGHHSRHPDYWKGRA